MKFKLFIATLFIIFLSIIIFSCEEILKPEIEEITGVIFKVEIPLYGSSASAFILKRPEGINSEEMYYKEYYFDESDEETPDFSQYHYKIIRVRGSLTNINIGSSSLTYIINPEIIEVKDIDYSKISQEEKTNPDSYIWK